MIVTRKRENLPDPPDGGSVVSVGVFDGVHLGHQSILAANVHSAREIGAVPTVVTFVQHPKQVLLGRAPRTLTSLEHRLELFQLAGIEHSIALTFDEALRQTPAGDFARDFLNRELDAKRLVLGFDSKFGRDREGTPQFLSEQGYQVEIAPKITIDGRPVSSTAIREAVELGDLSAAARMLGRGVSVLGEVVRGEALGRQMGFPTANLDLHHELHPPPGVYACQARHVLAAPRWQVLSTYPAVANIGFRPTLEGPPPELPRVEVHILDFDGDLYGEYIELEFVRGLRREQRFPSLDALKAQIAEDVARAREVLGVPAPRG